MKVKHVHVLFVMVIVVAAAMILSSCGTEKGAITQTTTSTVTGYDFSKADVKDGIAYIPIANSSGAEAAQVVREFQKRNGVNVRSWSIDRGGKYSDMWGVTVTYGDPY